jgi:ribonuclease VapC
MVLDTSALLAILLDEDEAESFALAVAADPVRLLSAANLVEASLVVESKRGEAGGRELDLLLHRGRVDVVAVTAEHAQIARSAWRRYGKGRHPAGLNFGDCFAYALSQSSGEALLFTGADFARTDVLVAAAALDRP